MNKALLSLISKKSFNGLGYVIKRAIQFEPPYLDADDSSVPKYPLLNVQVKGYDYAVLEKYAKWIHNTASHMDIDVADCWATPAQKLKIVSYKPGTSTVENTFHLQVYERNVQIEELSSTMAPIFLEVIKAALPEGVELSVHEHMQEYTDIRKIPDLQLRELKHQLDDLGGPTKKK